MSYQVANGSVLNISTGYGSALPVTVATNAASPVLTVTNTLVVGDYVEWTSGWSRASNRVFKVTAETGTTVTLGGIDTTSVVTFPAGMGVGSIRKANALTQISQVMELKYSGGEAKTKNFQFLEDDAEKELFLGRSASRLTLTLADDITTAGQVILTAANDDRARRAVQLVLPTGGVICYNALVAFNKSPTVSTDELVSAEAVLLLQADPVRY
jgi:hypothetical protein